MTKVTMTDCRQTDRQTDIFLAHSDIDIETQVPNILLTYVAGYDTCISQ